MNSGILGHKLVVMDRAKLNVNIYHDLSKILPRRRGAVLRLRIKQGVSGVWRVAANILSLELVPPNWRLGDGQTALHYTLLMYTKYFTTL
jgi:hypothetical protein